MIYLKRGTKTQLFYAALSLVSLSPVLCIEFEMAGPDLPSYTLVQGSAISFIAGMFLGIYLISLAFALRWLIFTDEGWMLKKSIHWFTLILTNVIAVLVSINQVMKVDVAIAEAEFVEQGHSPGKYVEHLPWRPIIEVGR
jgi:hypothetical protein